jgi:REP element-mobilizing transposase RayT
MLLVVIGPYCQAIFVTAGIAFSHCMSTWYFVAKYRRKVFDGDAIQRLKVMFEKVCTDFEAQLVEINGEAEHVHLLIHHPPKHSVSSMVNSLKGVSSRRPVSNGLILRNAIGRMSWGRRLTLPPVVAGHRWPSSSNTLSNKRPRFNPPYIPALKDRGFTARLVNPNARSPCEARRLLQERNREVLPGMGGGTFLKLLHSGPLAPGPYGMAGAKALALIRVP